MDTDTYTKRYVYHAASDHSHPLLLGDRSRISVVPFYTLGWEGACLVLLETTPQLLLRCTHEWPVPHDLFPRHPTCEHHHAEALSASSEPRRFRATRRVP